jgi:hypothetical protein
MITGACAIVAAVLTGGVLWFRAATPSQSQTIQNAPNSTNIQGGPGSVFNFNNPKTDTPPVPSGLAGDLAKLRHAGQKRFWAWWESCFDNLRPKPTDPARRADAEQMRQQIYDKLERERGTADAVFFNTPRMNEPFPPNSTLPLCAEGIEIKQFGYRLDRLGEIIDRIQRGG